MTDLEVKLAAYGMMLDILLREIAKSDPELMNRFINTATEVAGKSPLKNLNVLISRDARRINKSLKEAVDKIKKDTDLTD